jgi:hypothetical protein
LPFLGMSPDFTVLNSSSSPAIAGLDFVPAFIADANSGALTRLLEFQTPHIDNKNPRVAYGRAIPRFGTWCENERITLSRVAPLHVAANI